MTALRHWIDWVATLGLLGLLGCAGEPPNDIGAKQGRLTPCPGRPNCVASQMTSPEQAIAPLPGGENPEAAFVRLRMLLGRRLDTTVTIDTSDYLRVEFRTTFFVDDGEFLLDRENGVIQLRSASRLGYSDLGVNRRRIEAIRQDFSALNPGAADRPAS